MGGREAEIDMPITGAETGDEDGGQTCTWLRLMPGGTVIERATKVEELGGVSLASAPGPTRGESAPTV